jgi:signal transduction histidine kinase
MDAQKELIIFRIVQEAFNNIIKHAEARHAGLRLHYDETKLCIAVSDDGNGFDPDMVGSKKQAGLRNMETRTKMLGGTMNISSFPSYGTTLSFTIPFE